VPKKKASGCFLPRLEEVVRTWSFNVKFESPSMTVNSNVMVSIGEMTGDDVLFIGQASMSVLNVAPFNGGTWVRVHIPFDVAVIFQLMFVWGDTV
jgi:hypothetical protein